MKNGARLVDYLARVCTCNFNKLSTIMKELGTFSKKNELKLSWM